MNLLELSKLLLDEKLAEEYLREKGILKTFTNCEKCGSTKLGRIRRGRIRCYSCKAEWGIRKGSILHAQSISCSKFIGLVKCFELELPARTATDILELNRKTTNKIYYNIRLKITGLDENQFLYYGDLVREGSPIFQIKFVKGVAEITYENGLGESEFKVLRTRVPNSRASYFFDYKRIKYLLHHDKLEKFPTEADHFFRYIKERLLKFRGTQIQFLYLYLKEIEFRYNNRKGDNIFEKIVTQIAHF